MLVKCTVEVMARKNSKIEKVQARKVGRPTAYHDGIPDMLDEYFSGHPYEIKKKTIMSNGTPIEIETEVATDIPTIAGFAVKLGVARETLHDWSDKTNDDGSLKYPEFSDSYKRAKSYQEHWLATNGNKGLLNTAFAIFTAKNILKWTDRQDIAIDDKQKPQQTAAITEVGSKIISALEKWNG